MSGLPKESDVSTRLRLIRNRAFDESVIVRPRDGGPPIEIIVTVSHRHGEQSQRVVLDFVDYENHYKILRRELVEREE